MSRIVNKEFKWKHDKSWDGGRPPKDNCCNPSMEALHNMSMSGLEVLTPYPKKRNWFERFLNRYNHIMEFVRTFIQLLVLALQLIILYRLTN